MSIHTQMSLAGFIATAPDLTSRRTRAVPPRAGCEHFRKEVLTQLDPTFHDFVIFNVTAPHGSIVSSL